MGKTWRGRELELPVGEELRLAVALLPDQTLDRLLGAALAGRFRPVEQQLGRRVCRDAEAARVA